MSAPFEELVAIVTGGASGLGAAIAKRLKDEGATVAVFDLNPDAAPHADLAVRADVTDDASVIEAVERVRASNHQHPDHDTAEWPPRN